MASSITIREKEEWQAMLANKIQTKIKQLWASSPGLEAKLKQEAKERAYVALGVQKSLETVELLKPELEKTAKKVYDMYIKVLTDLGVDIDSCYGLNRDDFDFDSQYSTCINHLENKVDDHASVIYEQLLAADPVGAKIVALQEEISNVKQAIWLATSPTALRCLWQEFINRLQLPTSDLERVAFNAE